MLASTVPSAAPPLQAIGYPSIDLGHFAAPQDKFERVVTRRVASTYGYTAAGLGITFSAASLGYACLMPALATPVGGILVGATVLGSLVGTMGTRHDTAPLAKHAAWLMFTGSMGLSLSALGVLGGPALLQASLITLTLAGSLSCAAVVAPRGVFLPLEGPLRAGLLALILVGVAQVFLPPTWTLFAMADAAAILGSLLVFSGYMLVDTQRVLLEVRSCRPEGFDPIDQSVGIYLNIINLFISILRAMDKVNERTRARR